MVGNFINRIFLIMGAMIVEKVYTIIFCSSILGLTLIHLLLSKFYRWPIEEKISTLTSTYQNKLFEKKIFERKEYARFYRTSEWRALRDQFIKEQPKYSRRYKCKYCGCLLLKKEVHVDHVKPRSKYPELALEKENLAISCQSCNSTKGDKEWY